MSDLLWSIICPLPAASPAAHTAWFAQRVRRRRPNLDVHDVKQPDARVRTHGSVGAPHMPGTEFPRVVLRSGCKAQPTASRVNGASKQVIHAEGARARRRLRADACADARSLTCRRKSLLCLIFSRPSRSSCLAAEGMARPPVSPVCVPMRVRIALAAAAPSGTRARQADRSVDRTTGRWARCSRGYGCQTGAWLSLGLVSLGFRCRRQPGGSSLTSGQRGCCRSACGRNKATARVVNANVWCLLPKVK